MNKTTKIIIGAVVLILIVGFAWYSNKNQEQTVRNNKSMKIGAILALSGPSALWGESVRNGMNLALEDQPGLSVAYEDSKGTAADGITAYQNLKLKDPDIFVSAMSVVSIPLASLAKDDKKVMLITQSAANNITNEYAYRYYTDADHFALPSFESDISPLKNIKKLAVVYRKDEYATSVANKIKQLAAEQGKEIVFFESYTPNETDFSTILLKAKQASPEALLFIPTPPSESLGILKKVEELKFNIPIVEITFT